MAVSTVTSSTPTGRLLTFTGRRIAAVAFVLPLAYLVLAPIFWLQLEALGDGASAYEAEFGRATMPETLISTAWLACGSLAIAMVLGTLLAWSATLLPPRLRFMRILPIFPMILPLVSQVLGWIFLLSPGPGYLNAVLRRLPWWSGLTGGPVDVYSLPWIVIITGVSLTSFVYLFVSAGFQNINSELIESAHVSGSSGIGVFLRVILPIIRPQLLYGAAVALLIGLGQFTVPLLLGRTNGVRVITTEIFMALYGRQPQDPAAAAAIGSPLLVVGVAVVLIQRFLLGNSSRFVTHGGKGFRPVRRSSVLPAVFIGTYLLLSTVAPLVGLVIVALSPYWTSTVVPDALSLDNFRTLFAEPNLVDAIWTSIWVSFLAVCICLPIGFVASSLLLRAKDMPVLRGVLDVLIALPLGVPAVVFGVGFLLTYSREPFFLYGTNWVILVVYVTIMLPFTTRMHMSGMAALGDAYLEASRVCGAGPLRTNLQIVLPLLRGSVGGAAALMFVLLTHEFTASLLVRSTDVQVMGTILYDTFTNGYYPLVASIALIMTVVTFAGAALALLVGGAGTLEDL
ncbi:iron(III) transport system permease protein [Pseudonocardia thermophila]|uniref:Iron(III) transport system permease protein n=1 Tax=Pseudonocardia thermophila TaxID=1848 RepID=A0A1M7BAG0_PSETH|nr:iron ABC transporter permease [Pseudonocardia thermophila]SHL51917.1 iron(III) transport system permease protein [Pseudonocardia thermophila]